jgi:predicted enzyme related to lactoylglutathione lyase
MADWSGKFIWYELMTTDQEAAEVFYSAVVGWTTQKADAPNDHYTILNAGDRGVGGVMKIPDGASEAGVRPGWLGYIAVADTDATARSIAEAGGKIHRGPGDIPEVGRFAIVTDPGGAMFALLTPLPRGEAPPPTPANMPATIGWRELYAGNGHEAAFDFYSRLFGWTTIEVMDMGAMGKYRIFAIDGERAGGMMDKPDMLPAAAWGYYFTVEGIDAGKDRIEANGGQVLMGPHEVPDGSWIVSALDPQGAAFSLVSTRR